METHKHGVALVVVRAGAVGRDNVAGAVEVGGVKELEVVVAQALAPGRQVAADVVELGAEEVAGEGDVDVVGEGGGAEDGEAVLCFYLFILIKFIFPCYFPLNLISPNILLYAINGTYEKRERGEREMNEPWPGLFSTRRVARLGCGHSRRRLGSRPRR